MKSNQKLHQDIQNLDFNSLHRRWTEALRGTDENAIIKQLNNSMWRMGLFLMAAQVRFMEQTQNRGEFQPRLTGAEIELINQGFGLSIMNAIHRQSDPKNADPKKAVYSVAALIDEMEDRSHLFSRQAMFNAEGLPMDGSSNRSEYDRFMEDNQQFTIPDRLLVWRQIDKRNSDISELVNGFLENSECRQLKKDTVPKEVFAKLKKIIQGATLDVNNICNKFINHPANPYSRAEIISRIPIQRLLRSMQSVFRVAIFIETVILGYSDTKLVNPNWDTDSYASVLTSEGVTEIKHLEVKFKKQYRRVLKWGVHGFRKQKVR